MNISGRVFLTISVILRCRQFTKSVNRETNEELDPLCIAFKDFLHHLIISAIDTSVMPDKARVSMLSTRMSITISYQMLYVEDILFVSHIVILVYETAIHIGFSGL